MTKLIPTLSLLVALMSVSSAGAANQKKSLKFKDPVTALKSSVDGLYLAVGEGENIHLYDTRTWTELKKIHVQGEDFTWVGIAKNNDLLATSQHGLAFLWDLTSETPKASFRIESDGHAHYGPASISPDDQYLATSQVDPTSGIWKLESGQRVISIALDKIFFPEEGNVDMVGTDVMFSKDGSSLLVLCPATVSKDGKERKCKSTAATVDPISGSVKQLLGTGDGRITHIKPDGTGVMFAYSVESEAFVKVTPEPWTVTEIVPAKNQADFDVRTLNGNESLLAEIERSGTLRLWNVGERREVGHIRAHRAQGELAVFVSDSEIATAGCSKTEDVDMYGFGEALCVGGEVKIWPVQMLQQKK